VYSNIRVYPTRCNVPQFIYIWKLLYMFQVVLPPIIRGAYNCIYSIWYLSHRYCYLPLSWKRWNGVTNTRCCRYSCMRSWWWVEISSTKYRKVTEIQAHKKHNKIQLLQVNGALIITFFLKKYRVSKNSQYIWRCIVIIRCSETFWPPCII
jgi:hypothetical protein